jgi:hypothetical protein
LKNIKYQGELTKEMVDPVNNKQWIETIYWWSNFTNDNWKKAVDTLEKEGKKIILDSYNSYKENEPYPTCVNGKLTGWTLNGETEMLTKLEFDEEYNCTHSCF